MNSRQAAPPRRRRIFAVFTPRRRRIFAFFTPRRCGFGTGRGLGGSLTRWRTRWLRELTGWRTRWLSGTRRFRAAGRERETQSVAPPPGLGGVNRGYGAVAFCDRGGRSFYCSFFFSSFSFFSSSFFFSGEIGEWRPIRAVGAQSETSSHCCAICSCSLRLLTRQWRAM